VKSLFSILYSDTPNYGDQIGDYWSYLKVGDKLLCYGPEVNPEEHYIILTIHEDQSVTVRQGWNNNLWYNPSIQNFACCYWGGEGFEISI
jgi:hypothetical protein